MNRLHLNPARNAATLAAVLTTAYLTSRYSHLLFHSLTELYCITVAIGTFMVVWNSRRFIENHYFLLLGISSLPVAVLDLLHTLACNEMGIFPDYGANLPAQFWVAARYLQSGSLLIAPLFIGRRLRPYAVHTCYLLLLGLLIGLIFPWQLFPACYSEGIGITTFKRTSEVIICGGFSASLLLLVRRRNSFDGRVFLLLACSIVASVATELTFTFYAVPLESMNIAGHLLKVVATYFLYKAIIATSLEQPHNLLFRELTRSGEEMIRSHDDLEERIRSRTSELAHANEALREQLHFQQVLIDAIPTPVFYKDAQALYQGCNRAFEELIGLPRERIIGRTVYDTTPKELADIYFEMDAMLLKNPGNQSFEVEIKYNDNPVRQVVFTRATYQNSDGALGGLVGFMFDVTERKQLEHQLYLSQKLESIGKLAGGIAHDFNNITSVVNGYSDLLIEALPPDQQEYEYAQIIRECGERATNLTRQMLAFSRKQVLEMMPLDLTSTVGNLAKILGRIIGEDLQLELKLDSRTRPVMADTSQIEQIIMNLAVNARDAMPDGGCLTIETVNVVLDEDYAGDHRVVKPGPYVMLAVSDTGEGMSSEVRERIFEPFYTTKEMGKGTGLGLATVYGIVKQHNGYIWVYSEPGSGTTFKVYLPAIDGEARTEHRETEPGLRRGTETILVVDDEPYIRRLVTESMQRLGYRVLEASSGEEALLLGEAYGEGIDLLLTDVVMPEMNGRQLAETLASNRPAMKVVYMSGYTDRGIIRNGMLDNGIVFIQKPLSVAHLASRLRQVLDNDGGSAPQPVA
jgi:PAS domain S-box-containing protein